MPDKSAPPTDPTFNKVVDYFLRRPPHPKASKPKKATAKKSNRKSSDGVVSPKGKASQS